MGFEENMRKEMDNTLEHLKKELKGLRTGRANTAIVENVIVEVYGTKMKVRELANITVPEPRQILISPFDPSTANAISKGIEAANLNLQPKLEKSAIRIEIPPMDENMRKNLVKECKKKGEDTKITIREIRRKFNQQLQDDKKNSKITEDELRRSEKIVQEKTDKYCKDVDTACSEKEKEILTI